MVTKICDEWPSEVAKVKEYLTGCVFPPSKTIALINYLSSRMIVCRSELLKRATEINGGDAKNFVQTTLARVTMAIHQQGNVPDPGGWYFHEKTEFDMYVLDRGFSAAWREANSMDHT